MDKMIKTVLRIVEKYVQEVKNNPALVLTEADIQMQLFRRIIQNHQFNALYDTLDGQKTYAVHAEVSYFGKTGHLSNRVDLAIMDVSGLDTYVGKLDRGRRLGKEFEFHKSSVGIEIKLNRRRCKGRFLKDCKKDIDKIIRLKSERSDTEFIALAFDKKSRFDDEQEKSLRTRAENGNVRFFYIRLKR